MFDKPEIARATVTAVLAALVLTATSTAAQNEGGAAGICMARSIAPNLEEFEIIVPGDNVGALEAKGFRQNPCSAQMTSMVSKRRWRDTICSFTARATKEQLDEYEATYGERPNVLCGMAERLTTPWLRQGNRKQ